MSRTRQDEATMLGDQVQTVDRVHEHEHVTSRRQGKSTCQRCSDHLPPARPLQPDGGGRHRGEVASLRTPTARQMPCPHRRSPPRLNLPHSVGGARLSFCAIEHWCSRESNTCFGRRPTFMFDEVAAFRAFVRTKRRSGDTSPRSAQCSRQAPPHDTGSTAQPCGFGLDCRRRVQIVSGTHSKQNSTTRSARFPGCQGERSRTAEATSSSTRTEPRAAAHA